ncbi:ABC transporter permease subunit [Leifsonia shinshuensis]|uniref:ABC transporter permease n=1 Tax=Leifsonia TaxID=110932 RepID=UPI0028595210|nr:ABC transporter permease subunit [Leifsonia shinshuensis]MDR6971982.1 putative aldouronate transport system permease protein [Leifsonia shinshuensis]
MTSAPPVSSAPPVAAPAGQPRSTVTRGATTTTRRKRSLGQRWKIALRRHWQLYLLTILPLAYFVIFKYVPISNAIIAFKDYSPVLGVWGSPWTGWTNFELFLQNPQFPTLLSNTLILSGYAVLASFPIPLILALALNEVRHRWFQKTVQMITYAPYFISTVVVVSMLILIMAPRLGILSEVFGFFGVPSPDFLGDPDYFRHVYVWSDVWQTAGYSAVIYMAALSGIDPSLYEAARVDGASRLRKIWHVDIPGIMPTAMIVLILSVGNIMAIGFEKAFLLQNPLNLGQSEIIATYVYKLGILNADFGTATAVGLFNSVINLVLLLVVNWVARRVSGSGLW